MKILRVIVFNLLAAALMADAFWASIYSHQPGSWCEGYGPLLSAVVAACIFSVIRFNVRRFA